MPSNNPQPLVALAGGKSGGHVFPALAVAEELIAMGARVTLFGMQAGMERRLAEERDIPFVAIDAAPLVGRGLLGKASAVAKLSVNAWRARSQLKRLNVVAVLATGGFVSAPTVVGARLAGIPIILLEPNAEPGAANRLLSRWAKVAAVAYEVTGASLACPSEVLGVPVREDFAQVASTASGTACSRVLIVGGSQGAERLNTELPAAIVAAFAEVVVVHQCGASNMERTAEQWQAALGDDAVVERSSSSVSLRRDQLEVEVTPFISDMPHALALADLVISRAGAITLAELSVAGRAAILVPLPLAGAHQLGNALRQAELGAAIVVEQDQLESLGPTLRELISAPERLREMGQAARAASKPDAARDIARLVRDTASTAGRWAA